MASASNPLQQPPNRFAAMPPAAKRSALWQVLVAIASGIATLYILNLESFLELGRPVQVFVAGVAFLPALIGLYSGYHLLNGHGNGRYLAIGLNFVGMVLTLALLAEVFGLYQSFELLVDGIMANAIWLWGVVLAYVVVWVGGRLNPRSALHTRLQSAGWVIGLLAVLALLLASGLLNGIGHVLRTYVTDWPAAVLTVVAVIFGANAWHMLRLGDHYRETPDERAAWQGWLMLAPNIIGFTLFFAGPLLLSFYLSFTDSSVGQVPQVIGFANYGELLSLEFHMQTDFSVPSQSLLSFGYAVLMEVPLGDQTFVVGAKDVLFWRSMRNTIVFCLMLLPLATLPALALSLILNSKLPGMKFFRALYFLPSVAAVVGTALIWRWLYDPQIGYYNYVLGPIIDWLNSIGLAIEEPLWLSDPDVVLFSIVLLAAWGVVGYNTVLFLAGLQGIPKTLYEAAMIDGANRWRQFTSVTLPMLAPTTFFVIITTVVTGLQVFNEPYALFPARPIPVQATTSVYYMYTQGFQETEFGYASAIAWLLFLLIFGITLLQFRLNRNSAYE